MNAGDGPSCPSPEIVCCFIKISNLILLYSPSHNDRPQQPLPRSLPPPSLPSSKHETEGQFTLPFTTTTRYRLKHEPSPPSVVFRRDGGCFHPLLPSVASKRETGGVC